jgi:hypothetical protein
MAFQTMNPAIADTASILLSFSLLGVVLTGILYVAFGQITVRQLRKNPETKGQLGVEFVSGWDILNVAQTLSLPRKYVRWRDKSSLGLLPNSELIYRHTTKLDRFLGRMFFWIFSATATGLIAWAFLVA